MKLVCDSSHQTRRKDYPPLYQICLRTDDNLNPQIANGASLDLLDILVQTVANTYGKERDLTLIQGIDIAKDTSTYDCDISWNG